MARLSYIYIIWNIHVGVEAVEYALNTITYFRYIHGGCV